MAEPIICKQCGFQGGLDGEGTHVCFGTADIHKPAGRIKEKAMNNQEVSTGLTPDRTFVPIYRVYGKLGIVIPQGDNSNEYLIEYLCRAHAAEVLREMATQTLCNEDERRLRARAAEEEGQ